MVATEEKGIVRVIAYNQQLLEIKDQPDGNENLEISIPDGEYVVTSAKIKNVRVVVMQYG